MLRFISTVPESSIKINKKDLIEYFNLHENYLHRSIMGKDFIDFVKFMRFMSSRINSQDSEDLEIKAKTIKFLQFCTELGNERYNLLYKPSLNILLIMDKINYLNPHLVKLIDECLFKSLSKTSMTYLEKYMKLKVSFYQKLDNDLSLKAIF